MTLLIKNLPNQVTQANVLELLEEYGGVKHIFVTKDWRTCTGPNFAFVEMSVKDYEKLAMSDLNGCEWNGSQLQISEVISNEPPAQTFSLEAMADGDCCDFW